MKALFRILELIKLRKIKQSCMDNGHNMNCLTLLGLNNSRDFKLISGAILSTPVSKLQFNYQVLNYLVVILCQL